MNYGFPIAPTYIHFIRLQYVYTCSCTMCQCTYYMYFIYIYRIDDMRYIYSSWYRMDFDDMFDIIL